MDFSISEEHQALRAGVASVMHHFDAEYWLERDEDGKFPAEYHRAMADAGWLGITMPEEYGGSGLGVTEAAIMMSRRRYGSHVSSTYQPLRPSPDSRKGQPGAKGAVDSTPGIR